MRKDTTHNLTVAAMLSAVAFILMFIEFPIPMLIPSFVKMDFSDLPALLGAVVTLISLTLVGADNMLLPALAVIVGALLLLRDRLDESQETQKSEKEESVC